MNKYLIVKRLKKQTICTSKGKFNTNNTFRLTKLKLIKAPWKHL